MNEKVTVTPSVVFTLKEDFISKENTIFKHRNIVLAYNRKTMKQAEIQVPFNLRHNLQEYIEFMLYCCSDINEHCAELGVYKTPELLLERAFYQEQAEKLKSINLEPEKLFSELTFGGEYGAR